MSGSERPGHKRSNVIDFAYDSFLGEYNDILAMTELEEVWLKVRRDIGNEKCSVLYWKGLAGYYVMKALGLTGDIDSSVVVNVKVGSKDEAQLHNVASVKSSSFIENSIDFAALDLLRAKAYFLDILSESSLSATELEAIWNGVCVDVSPSDAIDLGVECAVDRMENLQPHGMHSLRDGTAVDKIDDEALAARITKSDRRREAKKRNKERKKQASEMDAILGSPLLRGLSPEQLESFVAVRSLFIEMKHQVNTYSILQSLRENGFDSNAASESLLLATSCGVEPSTPSPSAAVDVRNAIRTGMDVDRGCSMSSSSSSSSMNGGSSSSSSSSMNGSGGRGPQDVDSTPADHAVGSAATPGDWLTICKRSNSSQQKTPPLTFVCSSSSSRGSLSHESQSSSTIPTTAHAHDERCQQRYSYFLLDHYLTKLQQTNPGILLREQQGEIVYCGAAPSSKVEQFASISKNGRTGTVVSGHGHRSSSGSTNTTSQPLLLVSIDLHGMTRRPRRDILESSLAYYADLLAIANGTLCEKSNNSATGSNICSNNSKSKSGSDHNNCTPHFRVQYEIQNLVRCSGSTARSSSSSSSSPPPSSSSSSSFSSSAYLLNKLKHVQITYVVGRGSHSLRGRSVLHGFVTNYLQQYADRSLLEKQRQRRQSNQSASSFPYKQQQQQQQQQPLCDIVKTNSDGNTGEIIFHMRTSTTGS